MLGLELFECLLDFVDVVSQDCCIGDSVSPTLHPAYFIFFLILVASSAIIYLIGLRGLAVSPLHCSGHVDVAWLDPRELALLDFDARDHVLFWSIFKVAPLPGSVFAFLWFRLGRLIVHVLGGGAVLSSFNGLVIIGSSVTLNLTGGEGALWTLLL